MKVHRSNQAGRLVEALARVVSKPAPGGADVFAPETIVVQSAGMGRWLAMQLAERLGIWGNPAFPFPRGVIERVLSATDPETDDERPPFSAEALRWSVAKVLPTLVGDGDFAMLAGYLEDDRGGVARLQLAGQIADTFNRYALYRPKMVLDWEKGRGPVEAEHRWQPKLWRAIAPLHEPHLAQRARSFLSFTAKHPEHEAWAKLPARLAFFGIATLPPLFVEVLTALGAHVDVHLFSLLPTPTYFGDARSERSQARQRAKGKETQATLGAEPHAFLGSMGKMAAEFQDILEERAANYESGEELFEPPPATTLVQILQRGVFGVAPPEPAVVAAALDDRSLRIHCCHGPMREVQVLHNDLLDLFSRDPSLRPRDVIVMAPDIEAYAPYIDSVFGTDQDRGAQIPFRVADRSVRASFHVVDAFFRVIEVASGRLTAPEVVDLLNFEVVRERFQISPEETEAVREIVDALGIRWGQDEHHREQVGQPAFRENTWAFGLDRLVLGQAMGGNALWNDVLAWGGAAGSDGVLAGRVVEFCQSLFAAGASLTGERPVQEWCNVLGEVARRMLRVGEDAEFQLAQLRAALDEFRTLAGSAEFSEPVAARAVIEQLSRALGGAVPGGAFLSGGVTFCELVPMRSIPFRHVCVLGLSDDTFPRRERPPGFSLIGLHRRPGDRSPRDDDRYLFLEALLAARDGLWLSYAGQGIQDNRVRPPSVLVDELLDEVERCSGADGARVRDALVTTHPIQSFSPRYFSEEDGLFSFRSVDYRAAQALVAPRSETSFLAALVSAVPPGDLDVGLGELTGMLRFPARAFLQRRLGLYLQPQTTTLRDREPIELDALEQWGYGEFFLELARAGATEEEAVQVLRSRGMAAPGALGGLAIDDVKAKARQIVEAANEVAVHADLGHRDVEVNVPGGTIRGRLRGLHPGGALYTTYSKPKGSRQLDVWISHLLLCAAAPEGVGHVSTLVARGTRRRPEIVRFEPVEDAVTVLGDLLKIYRAGLENALPFFPDDAADLMERANKQGVDPQEVPARLTGRSYPVTNAYARQAFGDADPLAASMDSSELGVLTFPALARWIFEPLLANRVRG